MRAKLVAVTITLECAFRRVERRGSRGANHAGEASLVAGSVAFECALRVVVRRRMLRRLPVVFSLVLAACAPTRLVRGPSFDAARFADLLRDELGVEASWAPRPEVQPALGAAPMCEVQANLASEWRTAPTNRSDGPICLDETCRERLIVEAANDRIVLRVDSYRVRTRFRSTGMICPGPTLTSYELERSRSASRRQERAARRALNRLGEDRGTRR